jgi:hypothetical protein
MRTNAMTPVPADRHRARRGHSLLELVLVFASLSLVLGGVLLLMHSSRTAWQLASSKSRLQESGRRMLDTVLADLRRSGLTAVGGASLPSISERRRGPLATPRGNLVATMNYADEALVNEVLAWQGDGDHVARNAGRVSDEIVFQLPRDLDGNGTPLDANGDLEWSADLVSYRVVDDAAGRPWLERQVERAGVLVERRALGPSVTSITFDAIVNDRSLRFGTVDVVLYLEEIDGLGRRVRVAVEGSVQLRNILGS